MVWIIRRKYGNYSGNVVTIRWNYTYKKSSFPGLANLGKKASRLTDIVIGSFGRGSYDGMRIVFEDEGDETV
eukprot:1175540-Prorocentrum_minimum.AAC.2